MVSQWAACPVCSHTRRASLQRPRLTPWLRRTSRPLCRVSAAPPRLLQHVSWRSSSVCTLAARRGPTWFGWMAVPMRGLSSERWFACHRVELVFGAGASRCNILAAGLHCASAQHRARTLVRAPCCRHPTHGTCRHFWPALSRGRLPECALSVRSLRCASRPERAFHGELGAARASRGVSVLIVCVRLFWLSLLSLGLPG